MIRLRWSGCIFFFFNAFLTNTAVQDMLRAADTALGAVQCDAGAEDTELCTNSRITPFKAGPSVCVRS